MSISTMSMFGSPRLPIFRVCKNYNDRRASDVPAVSVADQRVNQTNTYIRQLPQGPD
jgi:hypothetical protein